MKRQGIEGFTFDSKAEEWAHWASGCWVHDKPKTEQAQEGLRRMWLEYCSEWATEAHHSPAQPQNTPEIGEGSGRGDKAPVWPLMLLAALAFVGVVSIGKSVGWW